MTYTLTIDNQALSIQPDVQHEYLMTTDQVALGYGVTPDAIRMQKQRRSEELIEGKHYCVTDRYAPTAANSNGVQSTTLWTKRGIVRLGFFIRSARARQFRDMAEDLVIGQLEQASQEVELISARMIGESTGQSRRAVLNYLAKFARVPAVAEYREWQSNALCKLYPLAEVAAAYEARGWVLQAPFRAHEGLTQPLRTPISLPALVRPQKLAPLPQLLLETSQQLTQAALSLMEQENKS